MFKNQVSTADHKVPTPGTMTLPEVLRIVTDSFTSATERHIEVGDGLEMFVVRLPPTATAPGVTSAEAAAADVPMEAGASAAAAQAPTGAPAAEAAAAQAQPVSAANSVDLFAAPYNAVEALGGEDVQEEKATVVIRRELKKD